MEEFQVKLEDFVKCLNLDTKRKLLEIFQI